MDPLEGLYQFSANLFIKLCRFLKINTITQFRIVLGLIAIIQTVMVGTGLYLFTTIGTYFPNYDEALFIYILYFYTLVIAVLTAKQWKTAFERQDLILDYLFDKATSSEEKLNFLTKSREANAFAIYLAMVASIIFWAMLKRNTELIAIIFIPAFLDILANGFATTWEISALSETAPKTATDI